MAESQSFIWTTASRSDRPRASANLSASFTWSRLTILRFTRIAAERATRSLWPRFRGDAAPAFVVLAFSFGIGQAEHGLGQLVQKLLRPGRILTGCVFSDVCVELLVIRPDFLGVILEFDEAQQLVMSGGPGSFRYAEPAFVNIQRGHGRGEK